MTGRAAPELPRLSREAGWLGAPPDACFAPEPGDNPFLRYRRLLWAHHRALAAGRSDAEYVAATEALDARVAEVCGRGFRVTPTLAAAALGERLGVELWVKDETGNVTGTHKARHLMGLALQLVGDDVAPQRRLAIASCGNAALAAATVASALGRPLDVFIPSWADEVLVAALEGLGADLCVCPRRPGELGDPCFARFREATAAGALAFCSVATENVWTLDGARTLAFEMIESLGPGNHLDALFVQVGGGALASGVMQGFVEAHDAGAIGRLPRFFAVQAAGCAPLRAAWDTLQAALAAEGPAVALARAVAEPEAFMRPWQPPEADGPQSIATGILDDMVYDWLPILWCLAATGGDVVVVSEDTLAEAHRLARTCTEVPVDPTGSAGLAGLLAARSLGQVAEGARVGVLFTGVDRGVA